MIDPQLEPYYDIMIAIFFGIIVVVSLVSLFDFPRTIVVNHYQIPN